MTIPDPAGTESVPIAPALTGLRQIAAGGMVGFAGLFISVALNFLHQFLLARTLTPGDVGLFNLAAAISTLLGLVIILGADRAIVRLVPKYAVAGDTAREIGAVYGVLTIVGILSTLAIPLLYLKADWVSSALFEKPELAPILKLFILSIPCTIFVRLSMGIFQAYKRIPVIALIEQITIPVLKVLLLSATVMLIGFTVGAAAYSYLLASVLGLLLAMGVLLPFINGMKRKTAPVFTLPVIFSATLPFFFVTLLNRTNTLTETLVIGAVSTNQQVGLYTLNLKITATLAIFLEAFSIIFAPVIAELHSQRNIRRLSEQLKIITHWIFVLTFPCAIILFFEAQDIMAVFGPEYLDGAIVLQSLTIGQFIYSILGISGLILIMTERNHLNMIDLIISIAISIVLDFTLIPRYGALGAAAAGAITIVLVNSLRLVQVYRVFRITPLSVGLLYPLSAGLVSAGLSSMVVRLWSFPGHFWRLVVFAAVEIMLYFLLILITSRFDGSAKLIHQILSGEN